MRDDGDVGKLIEVQHCSCRSAQISHIGLNSPNLEGNEESWAGLDRYAFPVEHISESCDGYFFTAKPIKARKGVRGMTLIPKKWSCKYCASCSKGTINWTYGSKQALCHCRCTEVQDAMILCITPIEKISPGPLDSENYIFPTELVRHFCNGRYFDPEFAVLEEEWE